MSTLPIRAYFNQEGSIVLAGMGMAFLYIRHGRALSYSSKHNDRLLQTQFVGNSGDASRVWNNLSSIRIVVWQSAQAISALLGYDNRVSILPTVSGAIRVAWLCL